MTEANRENSRDWTVLEAVSWIVCRAPPAAATPWLNLPGGHWRARDENIFSALEARASGRPWSRTAMKPCRTFSGPESQLPEAYHYRKCVRTWMRETGLSAMKLLELAKSIRNQFDADREAQTKQDNEYRSALAELNLKVKAGRLKVRGRKVDKRADNTPLTIREEIPPSYIDEPRQIQLDSWYGIEREVNWDWVDDPGPFYRDIVAWSADVIRIWPSTTAHRKRIPPGAMVKDWWMRLVQEYNDPDARPTGPRQSALAREYFEPLGFAAPSRETMITLRKESDGWGEPGRRPKSNR